MNLSECRKKIDSIDTEILSLLNRRAEVAKYVGLLKARAGLRIIDHEREAMILQKVSRENPGELCDDAAARIYQQILRESRQIQIEVRANLARNGELSK